MVLVLAALSVSACGDDDQAGGNGAGTVACEYPNYPVIGRYCLEAPGSQGSNNGCVQGGGVERDSCPTQGCVASCTYSLSNAEYRAYFYGAAVTPTAVAAACFGSMVETSTTGGCD